MVKRKKGEDKLTDDAFEREMQALMNAQEEYKKSQGIDDSKVQNPEFKTGGSLPQYAGRGSSRIDGGYDYPDEMMNSQYGRIPITMNNYMNPINGIQSPSSSDVRMQDGVRNYINPTSIDSVQNSVQNPTELTLNSEDYQQNSTSKSNSQYSAGPNYLGAGLSIGTSAITSAILASNAKKRKDELLKSIHTPKVQAQQVDYSRSRANVRSNQALTEATGRQVSKGARSASEAANIRAMARIGAQRVGGNQLSQSYQAEESQNANLRSQADQTNSKYGMADQRQRMMIESKYGDVGAQQLAGFIKGSGQTISNAMNESDQKQQFYNALNMRDPNYELDFQDSYDNLSARQKLLARMSGGMGVNANKKVSNGQK